MIFDSDVMIWVLRGNESAAKLVEYTKKRGISILTQLELFQGVKNREELKLIKSLFYDFDFIIYPLNENIGHRAAVYSEAFGLSHGLCTVDSLIAASVNITKYSAQLIPNIFD